MTGEKSLTREIGSLDWLVVSGDAAEAAKHLESGYSLERDEVGSFRADPIPRKLQSPSGLIGITHLVDSCGTAIALLDFALLPETAFLPAVLPPPPAAAIFLEPPPPALVAWEPPGSGR